MKNHRNSRIRNAILVAIIFLAFWLQVRQDIAATSQVELPKEITEIDLQIEKPAVQKKHNESQMHQHFGLTSKCRAPQLTKTLEAKTAESDNKSDGTNRTKEADQFDPMRWNYMLVTAYNAGDESQCDDTPCEASDLSNICDRLENGEKLVAANFVKLGSKIEIKNKDGVILGRYTVVDHTSSDYKYRVDIAFKLKEKKEALEIGKQTLLVRVIYEPKQDVMYKKLYAKK